MEAIVKMGDATERLHVNFLPVLAVEALGQEMRPSVLLYQRTLRHLYATSLDQFVERILQTSIVLRFLESDFCRHTVQFNQIVVETSWGFHLPGANFARCLIIGDNGLGSLTTSRCAKTQNLCDGLFLVIIQIGVKR